ncbi:MAG: hypothetical protein NPIRA04_33710 [Nitrospirales bacterium]|nr:MAG: hypothetical protein NPIRA04_33710 [Nitrospirales bacterium]
MSKVYEALQQAQTDRLQGKPRPLDERPEKETPKILPIRIVDQPKPTDTFPLYLEREMLQLHQNLTSVIGDVKKSIIQFLGSQDDDGTSTIVREYAKVLSTIHRKSVLLIDAHGDQAQFKYFSILPTHSLEQAILDDQDIREAVYQVGESQLFIASLNSQVRSITNTEISEKEEKVLTSAQYRFDCILIDSPTIHSSIDGLELCKRVTGVVLVVQAEESRSVIIENVKEQVIKNGGRVLGIVFNKEFHYIPDWIYKRL